MKILDNFLSLSGIGKKGLIWNNIPSLGEFTILAYEYHKCVTEIRRSLAPKRERSVLNKNISSAQKDLFDNN